MDVDMWLAAFTDDVNADEVRRHWNVQETPVLDAIIDSAPRFRLGRTQVPDLLPGESGPCEVGNVARLGDLT
jgi:hypothetical protein